MKIGFHGAARTVTGSKHLLILNNGKKYLLDCGMYQGMGSETDKLNREFGFNPAEVDYMILSHAHIDHCGLIPKLIKDGYRGKVFATPATKELASILLADSAGIQENDLKYVNKTRAAQGKLYFHHFIRWKMLMLHCSGLKQWITEHGLQLTRMFSSCILMPATLSEAPQFI